ncbi:MAG: FMN-binding negative transcriptional regulator [Terriglobales bacterium]|jgi:transcriptional regulator
MYVPKPFQEKDWQEIKRVIDQNSFATVVSCSAGIPVATHVPLRLVESGAEKWSLQGHVSRANQHWHLFERNERSLAIFAGPQAYVSPRWYDHVNVPTWNYVAVHVYGKTKVVQDPAELRTLMEGLVDRYEGHVEAPERYTIEKLPPDYLESQMNGIVGFEIAVEEVQASFKLSQNRDEKNYSNVIRELSKSEDQATRGVAQEMLCRRPRSQVHE